MRLKDIDPRLPFSEWRGNQEKVSDLITDLVRPEGNKVAAFDAPTGSGKSILAITVGLRLKVKTAILTPTIALQAQYMRDFKGLAVELKGKDNYQCVNAEWLTDIGSKQTVAQVKCNGVDPFKRTETGDDGREHVMRCDYSDTCPYYGVALPEARKADVVVANYAVFMYNTELRKMGFGLVICDEAHAMPDWIEKYFEKTLSSKEFEYTSVRFRKTLFQTWDEWFVWFDQITPAIQSDLTALESDLKDLKDNKPVEPAEDVRMWRVAFKEATRKADIVQELLSKIVDLKEAKTMQWQWRREDTPEEIVHTFLPVTMPAQDKNPIIAGFPKVILMSGTLTPKLLEFLRLGHAEFHSIQSTFPPKRCPIMYVPTVKMSGKVSDMDYMMWASKIDQMLAARPDRRGLVLTNSFDRMYRYLDFTSLKDRLIVQHRGMKQLEALSRFQHATGPRVLLAPAMNVGIDLPDDQCRFIVMSKVPHPALQPIMRARNKLYPHYYDMLTLESFAQGASRGFRSESDWCEVIITDDGWPYFWAKVESFAYDWLRDRIKAGTNRMMGGIQ